jgi:regulator of sigma E protease
MVLFDILIFILVLGLMVFFHELGHFLAAKACGIYVDRFSLGMPPRIFGIRLGETDYCIGALPLGGYVKMAGQEDAPMTDEERAKTYGNVPEHRRFDKKPVWQRVIVIVSGPLMNMVLAVLLYGVVAAIGAEVRESDADNRIGQVMPDSPASTAPLYAIPADGSEEVPSRAPDAVGWETGDRLLTINGGRIRNIMDVGIDAVLGGGSVMKVVVERTNADGTKTKYLSPVQPKPLSKDKRMRFGVSSFETAFVSSVTDKSQAQAKGLQPNDIIARANGKIVDTSTFIDMIEKTPEGQDVQLEISRGSETIPVTVQPETVGRLSGLEVWSSWEATEKPDENAKPVVIHVGADLEKETHLKAKDIITLFNGKPATIASMEEYVRAHPGETAEVEVQRPAILFGLLRKEGTLTAKIPIAPVREVAGIHFGTKTIFHRVPPAQIVPEAFNLTHQALMRTVRTLTMLVTGGLSPKELGGPVLIYQVTTQAAHEGYSWLLNITAFISVNLCVFNLLPLPILDGSLLVYFLLEGIRRKPLNTKILERIQQAGLVMIVCLLLYVTFNDVSRWVNNLVP